MPRTSTQKMRDAKVRARIRREFRYLARQPADPEIDALLDADIADIEGWTA